MISIFYNSHCGVGALYEEPGDIGNLAPPGYIELGGYEPIRVMPVLIALPDQIEHSPTDTMAPASRG